MLLPPRKTLRILFIGDAADPGGVRGGREPPSGVEEIFEISKVKRRFLPRLETQFLAFFSILIHLDLTHFVKF